MSWDEVCVLCAIRYQGGPSLLLPEDDEAVVQAEATRMANEMPGDLNIQDVSSKLIDALSLSHYRTQVYLGYSDLGYDRDCFAIGYFDTLNGAYNPCAHQPGRLLHPAGERADVRRVSGGDFAGDFSQVVTVVDGARKISEDISSCRTRALEGEPAPFNTWVHYACLAYLEGWLDCPLPSRIGRDGKPLTLPRELYELVNSRKDAPLEGLGALPCIDYYGTLDCFQYTEDEFGNRFQDFAFPAWRGTKNTAKALRAGLSGKDLLPALIEDCRYWMFARPDAWPTAPSVFSNMLDTFLDQGCIKQRQTCPLASLPFELLLHVLEHLEFPSIFNLALTCKSLYGCIMERRTLSHVMRHAMSHKDSPMHWIFPIAGLGQEHKTFHDTVLRWLMWNPGPSEDALDTAYCRFDEASFPRDSSKSDDSSYVPSEVGYDDTSDRTESDDASLDDEALDTDEDLTVDIVDVAIRPLQVILFDPDFPVSAFLRACYTTRSMRARRRRWELIKQFDELWSSYRRDGWERDDFAPPEVRWDFDSGGEILYCQCES